MPIELATEIDASQPETDDEHKNDAITRSISVDPEIWTEARLKSIREGKSLSSVIRDLLKNWVNESSNSGSVG